MTVTLLGGEMLNWSDLDGRHGPPPAGGVALGTLLGAVGGHVLVAGPHDPPLVSSLLDALPAGLPARRVTLLVRGLADAEALADRYAGRPGVAVSCGSLEKIAAEPAYDWIVALDGLDRLTSAEAVDVSWPENLARLAATLRPGGRLLLGMENPFGLHRLVAVPGPPRDSEWVTVEHHEPGRLRGRVERAGLSVLREYAAYPGPGAPAVLAGSDLAADPSLAGFFEATVCRTWQQDGRVLADPARLVRGAFRGGLGGELAPAWVVVAAVSDSVQVARDPAPAVVVGAARFDAGELPRGRTLEDLLVAAAARRDLPAMRELVASWQDAPVAGVPAGQIIVADRLAGLAPAGEPALALRTLAASMIEQGLGHLWPAPADEASLAALLAGMAGRELDPADVPDLPHRAVPAVRELMMARERLERELVEVRTKLDFFVRRVAARDAELKRLRQSNAILSATVPGRAANRVLCGLRAVRRAVRRARG